MTLILNRHWPALTALTVMRKTASARGASRSSGSKTMVLPSARNRAGPVALLNYILSGTVATSLMSVSVLEPVLVMRTS